MNAALSRMRGRERLTEWDTMEADERITQDVASPSPEERAAAAEVRQLLERALDKLPTSQRAVFVLREVEEMSTAETATCLNTSEENVKVMLHRARHRLRELLYAAAGSQAQSLLQLHLSRCDRVTASAMARITAIHRPSISNAAQ